MSRARRWAAAIVTMTLVLVACTSVDRPSVQGETVALPTPLSTFDASMAATVDALQAAVAGAGSRLDLAMAAYRPSEPETLLQVPRTVLRADLADPAEGYVVVYQAGDAAAARQRAQELADYLGSGFGHTNYPSDTRFSVAVVDDTVVFTNWSRARAADPQRAEAVFEAVSGVGEAIEVRK